MGKLGVGALFCAVRDFFDSLAKMLQSPTNKNYCNILLVLLTFPPQTTPPALLLRKIYLYSFGDLHDYLHDRLNLP